MMLVEVHNHAGGGAEGKHEEVGAMRAGDGHRSVPDERSRIRRAPWRKIEGRAGDHPRVHGDTRDRNPVDPVCASVLCFVLPVPNMSNIYRKHRKY